MIVDLNVVDSDPFSEKKFDVCVCGAGVAGITIALKLSQRLNVVLLEAGDYEYTAASQSIYKGTNSGREYYPLDTARLRYLGGTSNHWEGWCRPLDSYDFKQKSYVGFSGWPIERKDLDPYLIEAKSILDIPSVKEEKKSIWPEDVPDAISKSRDFKNIEFWYSTPTKFGKKYGEELERRHNLVCFLNANVTNINLTENLKNVEQVEVRTYSGRIFKINARVNILATGGIENPRILLNCNNQIEVGLGNENDLVGRFFAEHPHCKVGSFILQDQARASLAHNWINRVKARRFFAPSQRLMQQDNILNFGLLYYPNKPNNAPRFKERLKRLICEPTPFEDTVENIRGRLVKCDNIVDGVLRIASEQEPNPSSRIRLGSEFDRLEKRRVVLDWKLSEIDVHTIRQAAIRFGVFFADLGLGRVHVADWLLREGEDFELASVGKGEIVGGSHHMCTTRMANSPHKGVVDLNQRVFGIDNLYIAGSSVFSSGGHANPTFTIVQMSLRLAEHINAVLKNRP